jgi:hypothetical protein
MLSNLIPFLAAEDGYRHDRARREISDAARGRQLRKSRRSRSRSSA